MIYEFKISECYIVYILIFVHRNSGPYCQVLIDVYTGTALVFQDQQRVTLPRKAQIGDRFTVSLNEHEPVSINVNPSLLKCWFD